MCDAAAEEPHFLLGGFVLQSLAINITPHLLTNSDLTSWFVSPFKECKKNV